MMEWIQEVHRMIKSLAILILTALPLWLFPVAPASGEPIDDVVKAFDRYDYATAYRLAKVLAEKGSPKAQNILGYMYHAGQGIERDYSQAFSWYKKAADQGDGEGQNNVGVMYENGLGVWQNSSEAAKWYGLAAVQGIPRAQNNLAILYANGDGVNQDLVQAYFWFNLAAAGSPSSQRQLRDQAAENRELVAENMTPAQIAEALRLVRNWKGKQGPQPKGG
jgi:TPR repeat protein